MNRIILCAAIAVGCVFSTDQDVGAVSVCVGLRGDRKAFHKIVMLSNPLGSPSGEMSLQLQEFCNFNLSGLRKIQGMGSLIGRSTNSYLSSSRVPQNWVSMGRYRTNIWRSAGVNSFGADRSDLVLHPTVKPVAMVADALRDCSHRKGIGLDAFVGSGTTLIAAEQTGRRGFGIEIDPLYCDVTIRRLHAVCASALF